MLTAWTNGKPAVGIGACQGHLRFNLHQRATGRIAETGVSPGKVNGRHPCAKKIRTKRNDEFGTLKIVSGHGITEHLIVHGMADCRRQCFKNKKVSCGADGRQECLYQYALMAADRPV